ncbi:GDSL esterase/lipase [Dichanthelium oligosanthes]|uniref:GDSL esterase/lipase n=1 Tax=Dichanthelium oligosanthes TaxID=888268 RepID=A0A1E5VLS4_9POAL|nr:GDSL esterase/lipase [Dichanthelium oligosanthes]
MLVVAVLLATSGGVAWAASPRVPAVIVFGDSTVDTGNNNQIPTPLRADFPPYGRDMPGGPRATGRFGNGRLPPDLISEALGLPPLVPAYLDPAYGIDDFARGVCFASAGTGIDNATADVLRDLLGGLPTSSGCRAKAAKVPFELGSGGGGVSAHLTVIPLWKEVEYYEEYQRRLRARVGRSRAAAIVGGALHVVSIGTNDFLENYFLLATGRFAQFTVPEFEDFLVAGARDFLARIHRLGARRVTFAGLAAIGCLPLERTTNALRGGGCVEEYNEVARSYNAKLQAMVRSLRDEFPLLKLAYISVYESFLNLITDPAKYGLENVEEGCCATGKFEMGIMCNEDAPLTCDDAGKFLFWDAFHPTEKVNRLMANHTLEVCYQEGVL